MRTRTFKMDNILAISLLMIVGLINNTMANLVYPVIYLMGLILGFASMKYGIVLYVLFYTKLFGLYSNEVFSATNNISFSDAALCVAIGMFLAWFVKGLKGAKKRSLIKYIPIIILTMCMFTSVFVAYTRWGQPIVKSVITFRQYLPLLLCIPLGDAFYKGKIDFSKVFDIINILAVFSACIILIQYFLLPNMMFLQIVKSSADRMLGLEYRFLIHSSSQWFTLLCAYNFYCFRLNRKIFSLINFIALFVTIVFVSQTRIFFYSLFVILLFIEVLLRKGRGKQFRNILIVCFVALGSYYLVSNNGISFSDSLTQLFTSNESGTRLRALTFFSGTISNSHPFWGGGITNTAYASSPAAIGLKMNCFLSDLGMWGYYFQFGLQSCIALGYVFITMLKKSKLCNSHLYDLTTFFVVVSLLEMMTVIVDYSIIVILFSAVISESVLCIRGESGGRINNSIQRIKDIS